MRRTAYCKHQSSSSNVLGGSGKIMEENHAGEKKMC